MPNSRTTALTFYDPEIVFWAWPVPVQRFNVYDKYTDRISSFNHEDSVWELPIQGKTERLQFLSGDQGALQRNLISITQSELSPSTILKFGRSLLKNWNLYSQILIDGPDFVKVNWNKSVHDIDTAKAGKTLLALACRVSVGLWRPVFLPVVKNLDTRANHVVRAQRGRQVGRAAVISSDAQAGITRVLDNMALRSNLPDKEVEAMTALALMFQHGVRPVQIIALRVEHVRVVRDAMCDVNCVISFHAAKRRGGEAIELIRQMKPEWVGLMQQTLAGANLIGRSKVFGFSTLEVLWAEIKRVCSREGVKIDFTANFLRHTAAQSLADAGYDRSNIRAFLGHKKDNSAAAYIRASSKQTERINIALGVSKLYKNILSLANFVFVSVEDMLNATEDQQIGAVVGESLIAGIGLCSTGQSHCPFNPVTSCYGCKRFIPSLDRVSHEEAVTGMREQVLVYLRRAEDTKSTAHLQMTRALSGAQQALEAIDRINKGLS